MDETTIAPLVVGGVPVLLGVVFLTIGRVMTRRSRGWTRTTGVVVERRSGRADRGSLSPYPTFQWQDQHGEVHQHTSNVKQSLAPRPGTAVPVRYDPESPSRAHIDTYVQSGRIFVHLGVGLLALGVVVLAGVVAVLGSS